MAAPEINRAKIVARPKAEGWVNEGGGGHDTFTRPGMPFPIFVLRHRTLTIGVARSIAKAAGWI